EITVLSPYNDKIDARIVAGQARVFAHLGVPLVQADLQGSHEEWLDREIAACQTDVFCTADIDAFPLTRAAYDRAIGVARSGGIFGLAQTENRHNPDEIYAAPMFFAIGIATWEAMGRPSFKRGADRSDVGQEITRLARAQGVEVVMEYPTAACRAAWGLADRGMYGIGTFYGANDYFHLYQARVSPHARLVEMVADDIVAGGKLRFAAYVDLMVQQDYDRSLRGKLRNLFGLRRKLGAM
ncbi:MAG: hypothetical protein ABI459_11225, partial [Deltaproteobacteria bacterium]